MVSQHNHSYPLRTQPPVIPRLCTFVYSLALWVGIAPAALSASTDAPSAPPNTPSSQARPLQHCHIKGCQLKSYQATYTVFRDGDEIGQGTRTLEIQPVRDTSSNSTAPTSSFTYQLTSRSDLSWWIFSDHREDHSEGQLIPQGSGFQVVPLAYQFSRTGTGSNRAQSLRFLPEQQRLEAIKSYKDEAFDVNWHPHLHDAISYQLQMQLDFAPAPAGRGITDKTYDLVYKNDEHHYRFKVIGEDTLSLPIGDVKTLKLQRVRSPDSSRKTFIWLAQDYQYIVARLQQQKDGEIQADLQLSDYEATSSPHRSSQ